MNTVETRLEDIQALVDDWPAADIGRRWLRYVSRMQLVPELDSMAGHAGACARATHGRKRRRWQDLRARCLLLADELHAANPAFPEGGWRPDADLILRVAGGETRSA